MNNKHDKEIWLEASGWKYYNFDFDREIYSLIDLKPILALWKSKFSGNKLPAWRDFDPDEFGVWSDNYNLTEIHHNPFDLLYLHCGKNVAEIYGQDFTGKTMKDADSSIEEDCDIEHFLRLYGDKKVGMSTGLNQWNGKSDLSLQFLDLPLSDKGREITHFLTFRSVRENIYPL